MIVQPVVEPMEHYTALDRTLYMVGKGITYDTGGADIKAGGVMVRLQIICGELS